MKQNAQKLEEHLRAKDQEGREQEAPGLIEGGIREDKLRVWC